MFRTLSRAVALCGLLVGSTLFAQQPGAALPAPRISVAFPPGARVGATVEIAVSGTDMDGEEPTLIFSDPRIKAEYIAPPEPKDPKADPKKTKTPGMTKKKGAPTGNLKFKVTVPADLPTGGYDVRMSSKYGVSNPRIFTVGTLPEVEEKEPNNDVPEAQKVELGTTINGSINAPTDVDYLQFAGKAGQRVLAHCATSSIDSKARPQLELFNQSGTQLTSNRNHSGNDALLDVILPSDGEYLLRIAEFAYQFGGAENFYRLTLTTGPWVDAVFPPVVNPGKPTPVTVIGRNLPNGQPVPGTASIGRPALQTVAATITPPSDPATRTRMTFPGRVSPAMGTMDGFGFRLITPNGSVNPVPVFFSDDPVVLESDKPNNTLETAQAITVPSNVVGRIESQYDRDFYKFTAKKGDVFNLELFADRIGTGMDTYFVVRNEKGQDIGGEQDDDQDTIHPLSFFNRSGDPPAYKFTAQADGTYFVLVGSREANVTFGPQCAYWLRIAKPTPDYRTIVMPRNRGNPDALSGQANGEVALDLFVNRLNGFTGPVTVTAENLPAGVTAKPTVIGTGAKWGTLVLSVGAGAKELTGPITVKCTADIDGKALVREARPASITWAIPGQQNNTPTISRLDQQLILAIRPDDKAVLRLMADLATAKVKSKDKAGKDVEVAVASPLFVKPGDKITLPVKVEWQDATEKRANPVTVTMEATHVNAQATPVTVNNGQPLAIAKDKADAPVAIDVKPTATPGTYSVTLRGDTLIQYVRDPSQKDKKTPTTVAGYTTPITLTVLPTTLGKLTAQPPAGNALKPGASADIVVKVERQNDYAGPFTVLVTLPKGTTGLTVKEATIPAGANEVAVPVAVSADFKPATVSNVIVTATGTVHGKFPIEQEAKLNLTIVKAK